MEFAEEEFICPICGESFSPEYGNLNENGDIICPDCTDLPPLSEETIEQIDSKES